MKQQLRSLARSIAGWPIVGRFVRIGVSLLRLPNWRDETIARQAEASALIADLRGELAGVRAEKDALQLGLDRLSLGAAEQAAIARRFTERQDAFLNEQLPNLLDRVTEINHRQTAAEADATNLLRSAPVTFRKMAREIKSLENASAAMRAELASKADAAASEGRDDEIASAVAVLADRLAAAESAAAEARAQIDAKADAAASAEDRSRLAALAETANYLLNRVEFVRRELMFEQRYGATPTNAPGVPEGEIIATEKVAAARKTGLRLNLGCGHIPLEDYVNVDRRKLPGVDIVAEIDALPVAEGEAAEIFSAHTLEHFPEEQLRRSLLPYLVSRLRPGGVFRAVVPDAETMIREHVKGDYPWSALREVTFGGQDYDGDFHYTMFTPASLGALLEEAGLKDVNVIEKGRRNGACYEFEIEARNP